MVERILLSAIVLAAGCLGVAAADPGHAASISVEPDDAEVTGESADAATPATRTTPSPSNETNVTVNRTPNATANSTPNATGNPTPNATGQGAARGVVVTDENGTVLLRALVRINCSTLVANATPGYRTYSLRLVYVHEGTGERSTMLAGPLNGTVTDPFGPTPYDLRYVDLRFYGWTVLSHAAPERCIGPVAAGSVTSVPTASTRRTAPSTTG